MLVSFYCFHKHTTYLQFCTIYAEIKASKYARSGCMFAESSNQCSKTREWNPFPIQISVKTSHQRGQDFTQCVLLFFSINTGFEWDWFEIIYVSIQQSHLTSWVKKILGFTYMSEKYCFALCKVTAWNLSRRSAAQLSAIDSHPPSCSPQTVLLQRLFQFCFITVYKN